MFKQEEANALQKSASAAKNRRKEPASSFIYSSASSCCLDVSSRRFSKGNIRREGGQMERLNLSRRSFVKVAAATAAVSSLSLGLGAGLAQAESADTSESGVKRVRSCCRGCGKMECGVWVIVKDGRAVAVEGDESSFQSMGNCCAKSQASIQAAYHPDRLYYPMKRTNPKGEDDAGWCA